MGLVPDQLQSLQGAGAKISGGYARRRLRLAALGRGFDSRRLHHIPPLAGATPGRDVLGFPDFAQRLDETRSRIEAAARRAGTDPDQVTILAVTKGHDFSAMMCALKHGLIELGENRVQDALPKLELLDKLEDKRARVHLIGQLQTNKVNKVVGRFASIMGVDRPDLLAKIAQRAAGLQVIQPVWVQANISAEEQKGGASPDQLALLVEEVSASAALELVGLMAMGRAGAEEKELRSGFARLRELRDLHCPNGALSMGMSADFELAVEEGATHLRLGTTLFGPRPQRP